MAWPFLKQLLPILTVVSSSPTSPPTPTTTPDPTTHSKTTPKHFPRDPIASAYILYGLNNLLHSTYLFESPTYVTSARSSSSTKHPTLDQIRYYNFFAASIFCVNQLEHLNCGTCKHFNKTVSSHHLLYNYTMGTAAMITVHEVKKEVVLTFRGSDNLENYLQDATFIQITYKHDYKLHTGFFQATMSMYHQVVHKLQTVLDENPGFSVVILGHSLGGTMAAQTLFFFLNAEQFPHVQFSLYTYGEPRSGNKAFANYLNELTIPMVRVVSRADIIPHLFATNAADRIGISPRSDYYLHHHTEFWVNGTGHYCSTETYEDPDCSNSLGPIYSVLDHMWYLDVDYLPCFAADPAPVTHNFVSNPETLALPPVPTYIYPTLDKVVHTATKVAQPQLG